MAFMIVDRISFIVSDCVHGDLYTHSTSCRLFYQCVHGHLVELHCPDGLYFNAYKNYCDWPRNVNCDKKTTENIPTTTTSSTTVTHSTTTELTPSTPSTTTELTPSTPAVPNICQWKPGQEILMGNRCDAPDGSFVFQFDGNAVIYDSNNIPLWNTETAGIGHRFVFQTDGNLVMYSIRGAAVWNSQSHDRDGALLIFQQDRNLVIYNSDWLALWNTGTWI